MNISTYEARIKALEDQLNPPGPGGATGLLSVTVNPDIRGVNAQLAAMLPLLTGNREITILDENVQEGDTFTVSVTPSSDWKAVAFDPDGGGGMVPGETGETYTRTFEVHSEDDQGYLTVNCAASEEIPPASETDAALVKIQINPK